MDCDTWLSLLAGTGVYGYTDWTGNDIVFVISDLPLSDGRYPDI